MIKYPLEDILELPLSSGRRGIKNPNNICFMNAAIQCLAKCEDFAKYFLFGNYKNDINNFNPYGDQFVKRFRGILYQLYELNEIPINSHDFVKYISKNCSSWGIINLQDCHEFLTFLLTSLHENLNLSSNNTKEIKEKSQGLNESDKKASERFWKAGLNKDNSIIVNLFHGQYKNQVTFTKCKSTKITYEPFIYLGLPIPTYYKSICFRYFTKNFDKTNFSMKFSNTATIREMLNIIHDSGKGNKENIEILCLNSKKFISHAISCGENVKNYFKKGKEIIFYEKLDNSKIRGNIQIYLIFLENGKKVNYPVPIVVSQSNTIEDLYIKLYDTFLIDKHFFHYNSVGGKTTKLDKVKQIFRILYYNNSPGKSNYCDILKSHSLSDQFELNELVLFQYIVESKQNFPITFVVETKMKFNNEAFFINNSEKYELLGNSSLNPSSISIYDCFNTFRNEELLSNENTLFCKTCKQNETIYKKIDIFKAPLYLIIQIKRFRYQKSSSLFDFSSINQSKNDTLVEFPIDNLDLKDYIVDKDKKEEAIYDLVAVAQHVGQLNSGHYTSLCRVMGNKWYKFNDDKVTEIQKSEVVSSNAYILFYKKKKI